MKKIFLLLFIVLISSTSVTSFGQTTLDTVNVVKPEKYPGYKTGLNGWTDFLVKNLDRDLPVKEGAPAGRYTVLASFVVDSVGKVSDIMIDHDPGYNTAKEVKRIIALTDKRWTPAYSNGRPISYRHRQSITFVVN